MKEIVSNCLICKQYSRGDVNLQKYRNTLIEPFNTVGIDIIGPLPKSKSGKKFIILAIDHFSRYLEGKALAHKSAAEVAKFLVENIFLRYGKVKILLSDQGKEFRNKIIENICQIINCKKAYSSVYNPKSNGCIERCNQTLVQKLAKLCRDKWEIWDEFLPYAIYAFNISCISKIKFSPYEIIFGRQAYLDSEEVLANDCEKISENLDDYVARLEDIKNILKSIVISERESCIEKVRIGTSVNDLEIGEYVLKRKLGIEKGSKIEKQWIGPYKIMDKGTKGSYVIQDVYGRKMSINRKDLMRMGEDEDEEIEWCEKGGMSCNTLTFLKF